MADRNQTAKLSLLAFAGVVSTMISLFAMFTGAWGGWGKTVAEFCFWFLPAMSLPIFVCFLWFRLSGLILSLVIPFGTFFTLCAANIGSCLAGNCTTTDSVSIMFGTLTGMYRIWLALLIMPICLYFVCLLDTPQTEVR